MNLEPLVAPEIPTAAAVPPPAPVRKKWPVWWLPAAIATAAAISALLLARPWAKSEPVVWKATQFTTGPGLDTHPSFSPDGSAIVYASDRSGRFELYIKQLARGGREVALTSDGKENIEPAWSPEGSNIAYVSVRERGIFVISSLGGHPRRLTDFGSQPTWSPDGSRIVFRSEALVSMAITDMPPNRDTTLWSVSSEGGKAEALLTPEMVAGRPSAPAFSPDRRHLGFLLFPPSGPATICEMDLQTRRIKRLPTGDSAPFSFVYDADGTTNYYVGFNIRDGTQGLYRLVRDRQTRMPVGDPTVVTNIDFVAYRELAISNQGKKLAYAATSTVSNLWQVRRDGESKALINERTFRVSVPVFSPTGDKIAYVLRRRGQWADIFVSDADGSNSFQLTKQHAANFMPSWMPDGQEVVYISVRANQRNLYRYSMRDGGEHKFAELDTVPGFGSQGVPMGRLSPDGTQVVFHREANSVLQVWKLDLPTRKYTQLTFDKRPAGYPLWSPDGRDVVFEFHEGDSTNIAIVPAAGGTVRTITHERGHVWPFSYSPDRKELAVAAKLDEPWNIYAVDVATGKMRKLTDNTSLRVYVRYPSWSPKGDPIAFERNETTGNVYLTDVP
jgi:Tol biopolymer transport system component